VQAGFVRLWRSPYRFAANPLPVLFAAVKRTAIDHARSRKRRTDREQKAYEQREETVARFESNLEADERRREIEAAMEKLPPEQREVLVMKIWGELTFKEIGKSLGISQNTAASRYRYALKALRQELSTAAGHE